MSTEIQELRDTFDYHEDGYLIRRKNGKPCGTRANIRTGYAHVGFGGSGKKLLAHRVIYAIVHGAMPDGQIDHINGNRVDNRIENLRYVSASENSHNYKMPKTNTSGFQGVSWSAQTCKWMAYIRVDNRQVYLGLFEDINDAIHARKMAKMKYHPSSPEAIQYADEMFRAWSVGLCGLDDKKY